MMPPTFRELMYETCPKCKGVKSKYRCATCRDRGTVLTSFGEDLKFFVTDLIYDLAELREDK